MSHQYVYNKTIYFRNPWPSIKMLLHAKKTKNYIDHFKCDHLASDSVVGSHHALHSKGGMFKELLQKPLKRKHLKRPCVVLLFLIDRLNLHFSN